MAAALNTPSSTGGRALVLKTPAAFEPLLQPSRYKGLYGGRGGAKSHYFAEALIERHLMNPGFRSVCIREIQQSLSHSSKQLLEDKIKLYGLDSLFRVTNREIHAPGGGLIIFKGMQDHTAQSMKSLEGYDVAWVEEAQTLSATSLELLRPTIRKPNSELWFSWNPTNATDPVDAFFRGGERPPDSIVVQVSYRDNPWFSEELRREMEWDLRRDPVKWAHVWNGAYRQLSDAQVFTNWRVEPFETPAWVSSFMLGEDFGFSVDPNVLLRCWLRDERTLMFDYEVYGVGVEIDDTPHFLDSLLCEGRCPREDEEGRRWRGAKNCKLPSHKWARKWEIVADSSRPETISYLKRHGYPRTMSSIKGPNSVEEGVKFLQNYDLVVHERCTHLRDELTFYAYKTDPKTGVVLPVLSDKKNHVIDAARYAVEKLRRSVFPKAGVLS